MKRRLFLKNSTLGAGSLILSSQVSKIFAQAGKGGEFSAVRPCVMNIAEDCAWVIWSTSENSIGFVEISSKNDPKFKAPVKVFDSAGGIRNVSDFHIVKLKGLSLAKKYKIRAHSIQVVSVSESGLSEVSKKVSSEFEEFSTPNFSQEKISFVMINDMHEQTDKFTDLLAHSKGMDFAVFNGDMVNYMRSRKQMLKTFFNTACIHSRAPIYYVRGNHEARGSYSDNFMEFSPTSTGYPYFYFRQGPAFFIVLDAGEDKTDSDEEYYGTANFDEYRERQGKWLKEVVKLDAFKEALRRIIIVHVPPSLEGWHGGVHFGKVLSESIKGEKIDLVLSGHLHRFLVNKPDPKVIDAPVAICSNDEAFRVEISKEKIEIVRIDRSGGETPVNLNV